MLWSFKVHVRSHYRLLQLRQKKLTLEKLRKTPNFMKDKIEWFL